MITTSVDKRDLARLHKKINGLKKYSKELAFIEIQRAGFTIAADIKRPPIAVDTGNMRNNVGWTGKAVVARAPYSGYLEFGTQYQRAQPFFFFKVKAGIATLMRNIETRIGRLLKS